MKKLLGIVVLGLLFSSYSYANIFNDIFKSSMERCADDNATMSDYVAISDWKFVPKTKEDIAKDLAKIEEINNSDISKSQKYIEIKVLEDKEKLIKVRDVPQKEQLIAFNKFLKQKLKKKLEKPAYEKVFKNCSKLKKESPELFKAKYSLF